MQINELPNSSALNATDVFAKDTSGTTTEKINAQNLAAGIGVLGGLTSISATGTTNTTGAAITAGTYFYLNGELVQALTNIASGATFTNGTNYDDVTAGGLNSIYEKLTNKVSTCTAISNVSHFGSINVTVRSGNVVQVCAVVVLDANVSANETIVNLPYSAEYSGMYVTVFKDGANEFQFFVISGNVVTSLISQPSGSVFRFAFTYICKE